MEEVEYRLVLRDEFSKALQGAKTHADHLENSMHSLKSAVIGFIGAYAGFELIKESIASFEGLAKANAQLEASLKSTGGAAGETTEDLARQREELDKTSLSTEAQIENMQALLLTFTSVHKDVFQEASSAIADMSAKMGSDLQNTTIQVGKALQDPIKGISALHRVGVNFSEVQKQQIKNFVETGHAAKAQQLILKELETEFGGSAKAALEAAPVEAMKKQWEEVLVTIGGALEKAVVIIKPYVSALFNGIKDGIHWLEAHKEVIVDVGLAIVGATIAFVAYNIAQNASAISAGINTIATFASMVATDGLSAALYAAGIAGTVAWGAITLGITLIIPAVYELQKHFEGFKEFLYGIGYAAKSIFEGVGDAVLAIFDPVHAVQHLSDMMDRFSDVTAEFRRGELVAHTDFVNDQTKALNEETAKKKNKNPIEKISGKGAASLDSVLGNQTDKVSGTKQVIINVSINKLVEMIRIESQNIKDGATLGAEHVTRALVASVNQFQASIDT